jgi:hypothetical protein
VEYRYQTTPFAHQDEAFKISRMLPAYALFMEQGTGKSKVIIDTSAFLYGLGHITGVVVVAPNGVHRNWIVNEYPVHFPGFENFVVPAYWRSTPKVAEQEALDRLWDPSLIGLRVLTMNVEALQREPRKCPPFQLLKKFLGTFRCLYVVDESITIANEGARRTDNILQVASLAPFRRILSGMPFERVPQLFTQMAFLDPHILGHASFFTFRARYCEMKKVHLNGRKPFIDHVRDKQGQPVYRHLDELTRLLAPFSYKKQKSECLDLPPKLYVRRYFELAPEQRRIYNEMRSKSRAELEGMQFSATHVLARVTRLQQIASGYLVRIDAPETEDDSPTRVAMKIFPDPMKNPRIQALLEWLEDVGDQSGIIWGRFQVELDDIKAALLRFGRGKLVEYHGRVGASERDRAVAEFQDGTARWFLGHPAAAGRGLTLTAASVEAYYANQFYLELRLQSEDRAHRIGQTKSVTITDLEAVDTVDRKIIDSLRGKRDVVMSVMGWKDINEWMGE